MSKRRCKCDHGFPLCCCALGITGDALLYQSRLASAIAGWPSTDLDPEAVRDHNDRMAEARKARRASKPRVPLGQKPPPPPDCEPCRGEK